MEPHLNTRPFYVLLGRLLLFTSADDAVEGKLGALVVRADNGRHFSVVVDDADLLRRHCGDVRKLASLL